MILNHTNKNGKENISSISYYSNCNVNVYINAD